MIAELALPLAVVVRIFMKWLNGFNDNHYKKFKKKKGGGWGGENIDSYKQTAIMCPSIIISESCV